MAKRTIPLPVIPDMPCIYADDVANLSSSAGVLKFYLTRNDPPPEGEPDPISRIVAQIVAAVGSGPEFQEALDFLNATPRRLGTTNLTDLIRLPFERRPFRPTRFSDGSHGVLYTALKADTAEQEYGHWAPVVFGVGMGAPFHVRPHLISCRYSGRTNDFRPFLADFPWLTADQDYADCQRLGAAAKAEGLAGFFAPSARHPSGTTVPILAPGSASQPHQEREVIYLIDPTAAGGPIARVAA